MAYFANDIYAYLAGPLMKHLPPGSQMIAIDVASPFLTPFKLTLWRRYFVGALYSLPGLGFVAPGYTRMSADWFCRFWLRVQCCFTAVWRSPTMSSFP